MTRAEKSDLDTRTVLHMKATVADTFAEMVSSRAMMHSPLVRGRQVWLDWHFQTLNAIRQYRVEKRMLDLHELGLKAERLVEGAWR